MAEQLSAFFFFGGGGGLGFVCFLNHGRVSLRTPGISVGARALMREREKENVCLEKECSADLAGINNMKN